MQEATMVGYVDLLKGHSAFLDMLARLYYKPLSQEELDAIAQLSVDDLPEDARVADGFAEMLAYLHRGGSTLRQDVNVDYTSAFYGINSYEGQVAHPCESVFVGEEGLLMQAETRAVYRIYKAECIKKDPEIGIPDDHLSFELQFLSKMCERAAASLEAGDTAEAARNIAVQEAFLAEHIQAWFPAMQKVALHLLNTPFYKGLLKATEGYLELLAVDLADVESALDAPADASEEPAA